MTNRYDYKYFYNFYNRYKYKYKCIYDTDFCLNRYCIGDTAHLWVLPTSAHYRYPSRSYTVHLHSIPATSNLGAVS